MKTPIATGIYRESGIGHWPNLMHVSYSESDPDRLSPIYSPALIEKPSHEDPQDDLHPFKITGDMAEKLNFRVRNIRISGGSPNRVTYNGPRHAWQSNTNQQPDDEEQLGAYPGVAILDLGPSSPPNGYLRLGLCIGYPLTFALQEEGYERPNDRGFPVPCDDLIFPATQGPVIPVTTITGDYSQQSFPPACYFWKGLELPYFHLQWQFAGAGEVFSTCQTWDLSAGGRSYDTGARVHVFDWGSVPIYCYRFDNTDPNPPAFTEDVTIEAASFYEYDGIYHPTTGRRLTRR